MIAIDEVVLEDSQIICVLTRDMQSAKGKENIIQSVARMLTEKYGFDITDMERDFSIICHDPPWKVTKLASDC